MKILKIIITQFLGLEEMFRTNLKREASLYCHISAYMHALAYLKQDDPNLEMKKILFYKFITSDASSKDRYFSMLQKLKHAEDSIIFEALNEIERRKEENKEIGMGNLYRPFTIGVLTYEFEASD